MSPSEREGAASNELERRRLNVVRYGLIVVTVVATVLTFAFIMFLSSRMELGTALFSWAILYSAIVLVVVGVVCIIIYLLYKKLLVRS